jgi:(2Fe-2S) ferredoxin
MRASTNHGRGTLCGGIAASHPAASPCIVLMSAEHRQRRQLASATRRAQRLGVPAARHIFLCVDRRGSCASRRSMRASWKYLKRRLKQLGLRERLGVLLTKAACFDICRGGPIVVIHPDGVWYGLCDPPVLERIVQEHLLAGRIVEEYVIGHPPPCAAQIAPAPPAAERRQFDEVAE